MKKSIIMVFVFCTGFLIAQDMDIAGSYRAGGQRVEYQYYTRPNTHLPSQGPLGSTLLTINDSYGLGVSQVVAQIPSGYNFYENIVGPIGIPDMNALQYFLYVTFHPDGTGDITNSQVLAGATADCITEIQLLPLDDELDYSSDLGANIPVQTTMVTGQPNASPYAGGTAGSWSVSNSSFFSNFPDTPTSVIADFQLFGDEFVACYSGVADLGLPACYDAGGWIFDDGSVSGLTPEVCMAEYPYGYGSVWLPGMGCIVGDMGLAEGSPEAHGYCGNLCSPLLHSYPGAPNIGPTAGYLVEAAEGETLTSFAPLNQYYGLAPDLHVEWHYIDGDDAETGLGDIVGEDEDGDGSDFDNILGYPALNSTFMSPACGFDYPILGDVTGALAGVLIDANQDGTIDEYDGGITMADACVDWTVGGDETAAGTDAANAFYVMDASLGPWGNFLTWNAAMYQLSGDASFAAVDDSGHDLDHSQTIMLDLWIGEPFTGTPCTTDCDGIPDTPYNANGGRLIMTFEPTCIPVVTAISVLGELFEVGCGVASGGDVNEDGNVDVLDVVAVVTYILGSGELEAGCADVNGDGGVDVLDVVAMVSGILGNRGDEASSAVFNKTTDGMKMSADGIVDAVQMTLSHGSDFSINLTESAFVAEYHTDGSTTTLIVVNPTDDTIFSSEGEYNVEEAIAATTDGYIQTEVIVPNAITLGKAYPNPFNPSTSFNVNVAENCNVSVMVYNVNGQIVDVVQDGYMDAGNYNMTWNASSLASGLYIVKANAAGITASQKIMLIK